MTMLYFEAALRFIIEILAWIGVHDPGRIQPLTWEEVLSNIDHNANHGNRNAMQMIITDPGYFGSSEALSRWAVRVVSCESNWDPNAYNPAGPYIGPFQVLNGSAGDVRANTEQALSIYQRQGSGAWPNC